MDAHVDRDIGTVIVGVVARTQVLDREQAADDETDQRADGEWDVNVEDALDVSAQDCPHVVIMDIKLPGRDGLSVLRELRKRQSTKGTPAIVITSVIDYEICQHEVTSIGDASFLPKPFSPAHLLEEVRRVLAA